MSTIKSHPLSSLVVGVVLSTCGPACRSNDVQIVDLHADFRDIWAGRETPETGKQAEPDVPVVVDFSTTVDPARVTAQFVPVDNNKPCGSAIAATAFGSFVAPNIWSKATSSSARPSVPAPYNLFARKSISGAVNAEGALAAGGDVTLADFNLPSTLPTPISEAAALQVALQYLKIQTPPWVSAPAKNSPPTMALALVSQAIDPVNADDFKLLWEVGLMGSGVPDTVGLAVDAASGKVVETFPGMIR